MLDEDLDLYRTQEKRVVNPRAQWVRKPGHRQLTYKAESLQDGSQYLVYVRQNTNDELDFSCGLVLLTSDGKRLTLVRYNGASHIHGEIRYRCHIHQAREENIRNGVKPESHAILTDRYSSVNGALRCMIND